MKISNKNTTKSRLLDFLAVAEVKKPDFYKKTGLGNGFLDKNDNINSDKIEIIISNYPELNLTWLITGEGTMLRESKTNCTEIPKIPAAAGSENPDLQAKDSNKKEIIKVKPDKEIKLIPFYDTIAEAGTIQVSNMDPVSQPDEWIDAGDWFRDADAAMRVHGDSMFPVYKSGSIVVMKEVRDKSLIIYGQDYVLETSEYRVIKRIQRADEKGFWLACSVNDEVWEKGNLAGRLIHEPFDIAIDSVSRLFRVLGCVNRNESSRIVYAKH